MTVKALRQRGCRIDENLLQGRETPWLSAPAPERISAWSDERPRRDGHVMRPCSRSEHSCVSNLPAPCRAAASQPLA